MNIVETEVKAPPYTAGDVIAFPTSTMKAALVPPAYEEDDIPPRGRDYNIGRSANASSSPSCSPSPLSQHFQNLPDRLPLPTPAPLPGPGNAPGQLPPDVYDTTLAPWRAAIRRSIVRNVEWESKAIGRMQDLVRTPFLDAYFMYTSSLGTHTFFMTVLPACFFFGYDDIGRGLLMVLALGVYCSSFVKDLICSPRPFAPPVTRLTIGTHHLEYGFPSTHSTNSVSIALFLYSQLPPAASTVDSAFKSTTISPLTYNLACAALTWYTFSIVYGRLYTAMHSFTDCIVGVALGTGIWAWWWAYGLAVEAWIASGSWAVPSTIVPLCLVLVHKHPQPVDDCPCFEDAIAFVSVVMGSVLARWYAVRYGFDASFMQLVMPGSAWESWGDVGVWFTFAGLKMVFGILIIFAWRIIAKSTLHLILPPTFRLLAQGFKLPHRRFYTPATDYKSVPSELGLRPIPSVIDLPSQFEVGADEDAIGRGSAVRVRGLKPRGGGGMGGGSGGIGGAEGIYGGFYENGKERERSAMWEPERNEVKHYDADVLTKVIVYCGIALLACGCLPVLFEVLGWGVRSY